MKTACLVPVLSAVLLLGCGSDPYNWAYGPAVLGTTAVDSIDRALSNHVYAHPGIRLDDFEKFVQEAEHQNGLNFLVPPTTNGVLKFFYEGKKATYYGHFIKEETPPDNSSAFSPDEISDPLTLAAKLRAGADPLSSGLFSRFSRSGRAAIADDTAVAQDIKRVLAEELTALVDGPPIYHENRFREVSLNPRTKRLLEFRPKFQPSSDALDKFNAALNRLLLEDAYPQELARKEDIRWTHYYIAVQY